MPKPEIYDSAGVYDETLPPYLFKDDAGRLVPDDELLSRTMADLYADEQTKLHVLEVGAGTGRMTAQLAPYATTLVCSDKFPAMLGVLEQKHPAAHTLTTNTRDLARVLPPTGQFDFVGAYWTLSYPIGEHLETVEGERITPRADFSQGVAEAEAMIGGLTRYLTPEGRLMAYFFDSESPEQQAVTKIWEQLAPDPGGYRGFTRELATRALAEVAENSGRTFSETHHTGIAPFADAAELKNWYALAHCKSIGTLITSPVFEHETTALIEAYSLPDGRIELPVGMYDLRVEG